MESWLFLSLSLPGLTMTGHTLWQRGRALMVRRATDSYLDAVLAEAATLTVWPSPVPVTLAVPRRVTPERVQVAPRVVVAGAAHRHAVGAGIRH